MTIDGKNQVESVALNELVRRLKNVTLKCVFVLFVVEQAVTTGFRPRSRERRDAGGAMDKNVLREKASSLPGAYAAQAGARSPHRGDAARRGPLEMKDGVATLASVTAPPNKKKWTGWGGLFRRTKPAPKKASSDESSVSDDEVVRRRDAPTGVARLRFLSRPAKPRKPAAAATVIEHPHFQPLRGVATPGVFSTEVAKAASMASLASDYPIQITDAHLGIPLMARPSDWTPGRSSSQLNVSFSLLFYFFHFSFDLQKYNSEKLLLLSHTKLCFKFRFSRLNLIFISRYWSSIVGIQLFPFHLLNDFSILSPTRLLFSTLLASTFYFFVAHLLFQWCWINVPLLPTRVDGRESNS